MATKDEHLTKAKHNEFFVTSTDNPFFDWKVVGLFYAALQYVDAYFATKSVHPGDHSDRNWQMANAPELKPIFRDYRDLKNESRTARYEPPSVFDQNDVNFAQRKFDSIKKELLPLL